MQHVAWDKRRLLHASCHMRNSYFTQRFNELFCEYKLYSVVSRAMSNPVVQHATYNSSTVHIFFFLYFPEPFAPLSSIFTFFKSNNFESEFKINYLLFTTLKKKLLFIAKFWITFYPKQGFLI